MESVEQIISGTTIDGTVAFNKNGDLTVDEKVAIMKQIGEEILEENELRALFERKDHPRAYDGFEPSGRIHIAQGLMKAISTKRMLRCGCHCIFYVADWFAKLNNKCGGDLEKIRRLGRYFIEVWKAVGMDLESGNVEFVWTSEFIEHRAESYWLRVLDIARAFQVPRVQKCSTIMGREAGDNQPAGQIIYPVMQAADIFELETDICQLGVDQRKVNMLARDYCTKVGIENKPVMVMHHMLLGLIGGKMSKSIKGSAIFMDDTTEELQEKVMNADCPKGVEANPVLEYFKYLVFPAIETQTVPGTEDLKVCFGENYVELEKNYLDGKVEPIELKKELARCLNTLVDPVRKHFQSSSELADLQKFAQEVRLTR